MKDVFLKKVNLVFAVAYLNWNNWLSFLETRNNGCVSCRELCEDCSLNNSIFYTKKRVKLKEMLSEIVIKSVIQGLGCDKIE